MMTSEFPKGAGMPALPLACDQAAPPRKGIIRRWTGPLRRIPPKPRTEQPFSKRLLELAEIRPRNSGARLSSNGHGYVGSDPEILVVEDVARILRCTVDKARRIPRDQLAAYPGPGRHRLYLREDIIRFVQRSLSPSPEADILMRRIAGEVVGSRSGNGRERSAQRRTQ